jgi:hypothetical protein
MQLTEQDRRLIRLLQKDARISNQDLAVARQSGWEVRDNQDGDPGSRRKD